MRLSPTLLVVAFSTPKAVFSKFVPEYPEFNPDPLIISKVQTNTFSIFGSLGQFFMPKLVSKQDADAYPHQPKKTLDPVLFDKEFHREYNKRLLQSASPTTEELHHWKLVAQERLKGFTCPDGTYFPPNSLELKWDCRLWNASTKWSIRMATENFIAHRKDGSTSCIRTNNEGFPKDRGCGECITGGSKTSEDAIIALKKSNSHCLGMFTPTFNMFGCGYASNPASTYVDYWTENYGDWHSYEPDQTCIGGSGPTGPKVGCEDIDTFNCKLYKEKGYCEYSTNVQEQCKDTCGIGECAKSNNPASDTSGSSGSGNSNSNNSNCVDKEQTHCQTYKDAGYCSTEHIQEYCSKTCGVCTSTSGSGSGNGVCYDKEKQHCNLYKEKGYCGHDNIKDHCAKTCGVC